MTAGDATDGEADGPPWGHKQFALNEGDIVIASIRGLFVCAVATALVAAFGAGAAAQSIDFSRPYYEGRWAWQSSARPQENRQNTSRLQFNATADRAVYCYDGSCYNVTPRTTADGGFTFPGTGKNGFKFDPASSDAQLTGGYWYAFPSSRAPDATIVFRLKSGAPAPAAAAIDFSRPYYEGRWVWQSSARAQENRQNTSRFQFNATGERGVYCYDASCFAVKLTPAANGSFTFPGLGKNGFKFSSFNSERQLNGSYWYTFPSSKTPDATVVLNLKP